MACLLQPECNFLQGFFRCKLPVEVVDVEVKVLSMQGTHIFKRDRMTQLIRCVPWTTKLHPHTNIIKKTKTFLEVENKMGPIIPALVSQFRPPLPETNPKIRKDDSTEKRRRASPKKGSDQPPPKPPWHALPYYKLQLPPELPWHALPFCKLHQDCFSDSELDSESDEDERYQYKHGYETLI